MTIERYITKLESMIGENLGWSVEMAGDKEVYYIWKHQRGLVAVLKESIDELKEHSFETLEHLKNVASIL